MTPLRFFQLSYAEGTTRGDPQRMVLMLTTDKGTLREVELSIQQVAELAAKTTFMLHRYVKENR